MVDEAVDETVHKATTIHVPHDTTIDSILRVSLENSEDGALNWEQTSRIDPSDDDVYITGELAVRIFRVLQRNNITEKQFFHKINCRSISAYIAGLTDDIQIVGSLNYYNFLKHAEDTYTSTPQSQLDLACLLYDKNSKENFREIFDSSHNHHVVFLGTHKGIDLIFEKPGSGKARFSTLEKSKKDYHAKEVLFFNQEFKSSY